MEERTRLGLVVALPVQSTGVREIEAGQEEVPSLLAGADAGACQELRAEALKLAVAAARESPRLMGDHIHRAFEDLVSAEVARNPLVLVLEDLHWGDRPSIELAGAVLRNLPDTPLFVLALGRPETTSVFPGLWSERRL